MDIRVQNIDKQYASAYALADVSLDIGSGELIALLGPSGAGKTTLLRLIAGLETATAGRIFLGNEDASGKSVQQRHIGFVFQGYALFHKMSILDNVAFGLKVRPRPTRPTLAAIRKRAMDLLDLVQLSGLHDRYPQQLSGGQRQRVALARALAIEPRVLLLDEPFGALDAQVRRELRKWLREMHDRTGQTTLLVTHDQREALELADRLVVLRQGRIEQTGTPDDVYDKPTNPFVYGFIGDSSALPVAIVNTELRVNDRSIGLPAGDSTPGTAHLHFRPHDVEMVSDGPAVAGIVCASRRVGGMRRIELEIDGIHHRVEIDLPVDHPASGQTRVAFRPTRWRLFPKG